MKLESTRYEMTEEALDSLSLETLEYVLIDGIETSKKRLFKALANKLRFEVKDIPLEGKDFDHRLSVVKEVSLHYDP